MDQNDHNMEHSPSNISNIATKILNFSYYDPTPEERSILEKGFKFCPTPNKSDLLELEVDINEFIRKIELAAFFNTSSQPNEDCIARKKSDYCPPESRDPILSNMVKHIKLYARNLSSLPLPKVHDNVSEGERTAIYSLKNNHDIIITSVDKGNAIVILNRSDYVTNMNSCLNNDNYKKLHRNLDSKVMKHISDLAAKYSLCFGKKEVDFLTDFEHKTSNFYGLPKIHKSETISNLMNSSNSVYIKSPFPLDLPFRCISGGVNSPTSRLSEFLDILLKPFCAKIHSHIRDYIDFLNKLPSVDPHIIDDIILITCDAINMYNNIDINLGLKATKYWLIKHPELLHHRFTTEFVLESLELVLLNSNFQFNGENFSLIKGTATGTTVAPTYATLVMAYLEVELYTNIKSVFGDIVHDYFVTNWKRFLDDGFILWRRSFGDFSLVLNMLNALDSHLNFTCEQSDTGLPFLNLFIYKDNMSIKSDIYYKSTDSHDYMPFRSCHPRHIKINIPGNLARMICTIVDDPLRKEHRLQELRQWLRNGGYPRRLVSSKINQFRFKDTQFLRNKVVRDNSDQLLVFVHKHNPKNPYVFSYLRNAFTSLKLTSHFSDIFKNTKLIKSVRQPPNLGRLLQRHDISVSGIPNGCVKCNKSNCGTCPYILNTDTVYFHNIFTGVKTNFKLLKPFSCTSKDIIYKIACKGDGCSQFYLGQTVHLRNRVTKHKSDLRYEINRNMKVHKHIHACAASDYEFPFTIVPFYHVRQGTLTARLTIEDYFRRKFGATLNG